MNRQNNKPPKSKNNRHSKGSGPRIGKSRMAPKDHKPSVVKNKFGRKIKPKYEEPSTEPNLKSGDIRLNKYIANSGICSRREADVFIGTGVVKVNGKIVTELGYKVKPYDKVEFEGQILKNEEKVYIVMNKPKGVISAVSSDQNETTVIDLVKDHCKERLYPVGRLDKPTTGVLLITNDGDLTKKLTHPSHNIKKIYQANLDKDLTKNDMDRLVEGITLEDGKVFVDEISYVDVDNKRKIGLQIHSGKNRIVRRMFEHLGYHVRQLDRVYFAGITKKNVRRGTWRYLSEKEVSFLKML